MAPDRLARFRNTLFYAIEQALRFHLHRRGPVEPGPYLGDNAVQRSRFGQDPVSDSTRALESDRVFFVRDDDERNVSGGAIAPQHLAERKAIQDRKAELRDDDRGRPHERLHHGLAAVACLNHVAVFVCEFDAVAGEEVFVGVGDENSAVVVAGVDNTFCSPAYCMRISRGGSVIWLKGVGRTTCPARCLREMPR